MDDIPAIDLRTYTRAKPRSRIIWRLAVVAVVILLVSGATYPILPRMYSATADVLLRPTNEEGATTWEQSVRDAIDDNAIQTKVDILRSDALQLSVVDRLNLIADPEFNSTLHPSVLHEMAALPWLAPWMPTQRSDRMRVEAAMLKHLIIRRSKSYLMSVGYDSRNPKKAALLANTLAEVFHADEVKRKIRSQDNLLASLKERIKTLEAQYHANEQAEQDFIVSSGLIHRGDKLAMDRQLATLGPAYSDALNHAIEANSRAAMLAKQQKSGLENTSAALSSLLLQQLRERLVELSSGVGTNSYPVGGGNVQTLGALRHGIEVETQRLVLAAQIDAGVAMENAGSLRSELTRLDRRLMQWDDNERHRADLHRAVETSLEALHEANQRYSQQAGKGDALQADVEIISLAEAPDRPSFPNPLLYIVGTLALISLVCGLMLLPRLRIPAAVYDR